MTDESNKDTIIEVAIDDIRVSPFQPRRMFSNEELQELVTSLKSVGLIHPPVVREIRNGSQVLYYELIAGERRWRAMQLAGYTTIPVILKHVITDGVAAEATLIENIQRVNLNPIEMAEAFKRLIHVFGLTQDKVAYKVGKKRSTVANYLRLLALSKTIQESLCHGQITLGHAKVILTLEDPILREKLNEIIVKKQLAVREAEIVARQLTNEERVFIENKHPSSRMETSSNQCEELEQRLSDLSGYKVQVKIQRSGATVSFHLEDSNDLEKLETWLSGHGAIGNNLN
ncbi:Probable chromosome-partitioning protein parB,plasmid partitioning protein,ParB/RepB/Spo0J family partition protein,ParB-like nuclease domain [Chlamydia serpentis]|uniref:Probable chromosome-partitioning protein parB,plasmid partitioning protein,ParB/RepB/Spo0J family partition protein,ParB-like nuclease domain n=1 Tax=Chlamydia serpentis TaxID=1967782 RepID=A0A2R8FBK1_9CHLA|nr:ParB/RepB/Spo0J family partition protein [Chlamydia serpentis]SPN73804.1 Probable chromosome-partitioning protein parB,plasmid partitioning protein,ParB/RepB/Spo0J family partition protein,ParB-like nuclease domain [Chlamydia serpentis]